jgi:O-antigen ligase
VAVFAVTRLTAGPKRLAGYALLALALVPAIYSLNRGLWLSIAFVLGYVALRALLRGRPRPFVNLAAIALVLAALAVLTPLGDLAASRLETGHSDARRTSLVQQSLDGIAEAPIVGHGGPRVNPEQPDRAPIGTHGQIWLIGYSHGIPAVVLFVLTLAAILMGTWRANENELGFWVNAVVFVALVQMFFYSLIPVQLQLIMILSGISLAQAGEVVEPVPVWDEPEP